MLMNMAASLIIHESIETTLIRAKELRSYVEKLVTRAKGGSLHDRRIVISRLRNKEATLKLFNELAPRYANRPGGYTRIVKLGYRKGDAAPKAIVFRQAQIPCTRHVPASRCLLYRTLRPLSPRWDPSLRIQHCSDHG